MGDQLEYFSYVAKDRNTLYDTPKCVELFTQCYCKHEPSTTPLSEPQFSQNNTFPHLTHILPDTLLSDICLLGL